MADAWTHDERTGAPVLDRVADLQRGRQHHRHPRPPPRRRARGRHARGRRRQPRRHRRSRPLDRPAHARPAPARAHVERRAGRGLSRRVRLGHRAPLRRAGRDGRRRQPPSRRPAARCIAAVVRGADLAIGSRYVARRCHPEVEAWRAGCCPAAATCTPRPCSASACTTPPPASAPTASALLQRIDFANLRAERLRIPDRGRLAGGPQRRPRHRSADHVRGPRRRRVEDVQGHRGRGTAPGDALGCGRARCAGAGAPRPSFPAAKLVGCEPGG